MTVDDAAAMGRIVAVLHGLRIVVPAAPSDPSRRSFREAHWLELAERGADAGAAWAGRVRANIAAIMRVEGILDRLPPPRDRIGSHCDLNAHNVLFGQELMLIDWDGADAADPGFERASYADLWDPRRLALPTRLALRPSLAAISTAVEHSMPKTSTHWAAG